MKGINMTCFPLAFLLALAAGRGAATTGGGVRRGSSARVVVCASIIIIVVIAAIRVGICANKEEIQKKGTRKKNDEKMHSVKRK
jgi:hypothetical protein